MTGANHDAARGRALLATMERIRAFERAAEAAAVRDQLVLGAIHLSIGQEAVAAGVMYAAQPDDLLLSTHRGHGHTLAKGADPAAMMKELLGREGGSCGGKGGSMHIADFGVGMLGANGVVAANITIGAGAAHGIKLMGGDRIVFDVFGDGAINRGPFLEGLNWAQVFALPVLFVCEDNEWSATTRTSDMTGGEGASARARAIGLHAEEVDGDDADAVADRGPRARGPRALRRRAPRSCTPGPTAITATPISTPPPTAPRARADARIKASDPIVRMRERLEGAGEGDLDAIREAARGRDGGRP